MDKHQPDEDTRSLIDELFGSKARPRFESLEEANRFVQQRAREYNARPQAELGGLSPMQMEQLLRGDWMERGAIRLNRDLTLDELHAANMLHDSRTVLAFLRDEGPAKATQAGNLSRAVVAALLPRLRGYDAVVSEHYHSSQTPNESDAFGLLVLRHVLTLAGLIIRRKGFRLTKRGRELLAPERAGELYARLFVTFFRRLNLGVLDRDGRHQGLQHTIAYSFCMLGRHARDWSAPRQLAEVAWLHSAKDPPTQFELEHTDFRHYAFLHRVLNPLVEFGLLEERLLPAEKPWVRNVEMRLAPLFDRFITIRFD